MSTIPEIEPAVEPQVVKRSHQDKVTRGIGWLDEHHPGWRERVDPSQLSMRNCFRCVLGQVFGGELGLNDYSNGYSQILGPLGDKCGRREAQQWATAHGFDGDCALMLSPFEVARVRARQDEYPALQAEWLLQLGEIIE